MVRKGTAFHAGSRRQQLTTFLSKTACAFVADNFNGGALVNAQRLLHLLAVLGFAHIHDFESCLCLSGHQWHS